MSVPDVLDGAVAAWIGETPGCRVLRSVRVDRGRPCHVVTIATSGERKRMLKGPRAPCRVEARSAMLAGYGTACEAAALGALCDTGVLVPRLHGYLHDHRALLMGRAQGADTIQQAPPGDRGPLLRGYGRQLTLLHGLEPGRLPGWRPSTRGAGRPGCSVRWRR